MSKRKKHVLDLLLTLTLNLVFLSGVIGRIMASKVFMPYARTCEYVLLHGKGLVMKLMIKSWSILD